MTAVVAGGVFAAIYWQGPRGRFGVFHPTGRLVALEGRPLPNPEKWAKKGRTASGRILVGFNVGSRPRWKLRDLKKKFRAIRERQKRLVDATFMATEGFYTHSAPGKRAKVIDEKGAQILVLNVEGIPPATFRRELVALAEEIARDFKQKEVIVEILRGSSVTTIGVVP